MKYIKEKRVSGTILCKYLILSKFIFVKYLMPRKERYQEAGHYHIINRGVERRAIYLELEDYEFFLLLFTLSLTFHRVRLFYLKQTKTKTISIYPKSR